MNPPTRHLLFLASILAFFTSPLHAATELERQLSDLLAQRKKEIAAAEEPINRRCQTALEQLLRKATQSGDLDGAMKIKAAIASFDPHAVGSRVVGHWADDGKKSRLQFSATGAFQENWDNKVAEGRWVATSDTDVKITFKKDGNVRDYQLSPDGQSIKRMVDGKIWKRDE